jgi:hypothetical protein
MNILFLDIDGVLNSGRSFCATDHSPTGSFSDWVFASVDPIGVALINRACKEQDLKIVASTSHRTKFLRPDTHFDNLGPDGCERMVRPYVDLPRLQEYFGKLGIKPEYVIDATPQLHFPNRVRGHEIAYWLENCEFGDVEYAIIDDDSDMLPEQRDRFVHTTNRDGITFDCFIKLEGLFGGRKPKIRIPTREANDKQ